LTGTLATDCRLYLVTPPRFDPAAFRDHLAAALDAGDVACVQLRLTDATDDQIRRAIDTLRPVVQDRDVAFLLCGRPDLAAATGCDGVHVEQGGAAQRDARRIVGADRIVGVSCRTSRHEAMTAGEDGADYVSFGPFFPSATVPDVTDYAAAELVAWWAELFEIPSVAIGGITPATCGPLVAAGTDFLAAASSVWDHPDGPAAAVRAFNTAIENARG